MTYMNSRDIYFYMVKKGGVRGFHSLVREDRAQEHLVALDRAAWKAYKEGRAKNLHTFEARTLQGEVVEL